jgi:hypothetical protein
VLAPAFVDGTRMSDQHSDKSVEVVVAQRMRDADVSEEIARGMVALENLRAWRVTRSDDFSSVAAITAALEIAAEVMILTPAEQDAIQCVLDDPPESVAQLQLFLAAHRPATAALRRSNRDARSE